MKKFFQTANAAPVLFLVGYQALALVLVPWYLLTHSPSLLLWSSSFMLFCCGGLSITFGYHRLFSHKAFTTHPIVEAITLFFAAMTFQGSCLRWAYEHRIHHAFVDTDKDPYCIKKGFLFAHCLWLYNKPKPIEEGVVADLIRNPRVMFQHKFSKAAMIVTNLIAILVVGAITSEWTGAIVLSFMLRLFLNHHTTWFINSLAHTWGARHFCHELSAVDNFIISLVTFGEGYHNYHHTFANDYRNGIRWYHFDPTKWLIWVLSKLGLANKLHRIDHALVAKKIIQEKTLLFVQGLDEQWEIYKKDLIALSDKISEHLLELREARKNFQPTKELKSRVRQEIKQWRRTYRFLKKSIAVSNG